MVTLMSAGKQYAKLTEARWPDLHTLLHSTFRPQRLPRPTRRPSAAPRPPAATACSSCRPAPANRCATNSPRSAREGTGLVISPLIALMDDQAAKLTAAGLNVARIHSGLSREHSRQACRDYLDGKLDFLFIAPERMRVPGFPEMLAKRQACADRNRRSSLHLRLGPRLSARL